MLLLHHIICLILLWWIHYIAVQMATKGILSVIASNVRMLRKAQGWSQTVLGQKSGLPRSTIAQLEICRYDTVTLDVLVPIAGALGSTLDALLMTQQPKSQRMSRSSRTATGSGPPPTG